VASDPSQDNIKVDIVANQILSINAKGDLIENQFKCVFVTNRNSNIVKASNNLPRTGGINQYISISSLLVILISFIIKNINPYVKNH
jgi:hypothetical protein